MRGADCPHQQNESQFRAGLIQTGTKLTFILLVGTFPALGPQARPEGGGRGVIPRPEAPGVCLCVCICVCVCALVHTRALRGVPRPRAPRGSTQDFYNLAEAGAAQKVLRARDSFLAG